MVRFPVATRRPPTGAVQLATKLRLCPKCPGVYRWYIAPSPFTATTYEHRARSRVATFRNLGFECVLEVPASPCVSRFPAVVYARRRRFRKVANPGFPGAARLAYSFMQSTFYPKQWPNFSNYFGAALQTTCRAFDRRFCGVLRRALLLLRTIVRMMETYWVVADKMLLSRDGKHEVSQNRTILGERMKQTSLPIHQQPKFSVGKLTALLVCCVVQLASSEAYGQLTEAVATDTNGDMLSDQEWQQVDGAIARANRWIVSMQGRNGSFPTARHGQPGVTSFAALALLAQGVMPDRGEFGENLSQAIEYVIDCQRRSGLIALAIPNTPEIPRGVSHLSGTTAVYNHAISALMLSEAYGSIDIERSDDLQEAIELALRATLAEQARPKRKAENHGGWRYLHRFDASDADLSIIGWQLMFLRSAKNAGFDVPEQAIKDAVACVQGHFVQDRQGFEYTVGGGSLSRAMTGAGILALAHAGYHDTAEARQAGNTLLGYSFQDYNRSSGDLDRYHYSLFLCTQAAYQMGDEYWNQFCPTTFRTLLASQNSNGSWEPERTIHNDDVYGSVYTTALVVLSLSAPNQLLPIFQR